MLSLCCQNQNTVFLFICSAEDLFTSTSNEFRKVYKVDGNPQLDARDWSMCSKNLKSLITCCAKLLKCDWLKAVQLNCDCTAENSTE